MQWSKSLSLWMSPWALALGLAACGGGDATDVAAAAPAEADEAQAQHELLGGFAPDELVAHLRPEFGLQDLVQGKRLFERETFGGNGRTCLTCHSRDSG